MDVLVLSTIELFGFQLMTCLGEAGHRVHLCNDLPWAIPHRLSRYCHKHVHQPRRFLSEPTPELAQFINDYCRDHHIDIVLPAAMRTTRSVAILKEQITQATIGAMPGIDTINLLHDKWRFSRFLNQHALPTPQTEMIQSVDQARTLDIEFPVLVKPPEGESGEGIRRIDTHEQLLDHLRSPQDVGPLPCLVQRFIHGHDIDISIIANHGKLIAWTIQQRDPHDPATIHFLDHPEVLRITRGIVEHSNYHGVAHLDMRIDEQTGTVYVIELNPRFWGSMLWSLWAGVNFPDLLVRMTLGQSLDAPITAESGPCRHTGLACGELINALLHGRSMPDGLSNASANAWRTNHTDPLPQVYYKISEYFKRLTG